jgi:hypothetical protein
MPEEPAGATAARLHRLLGRGLIERVGRQWFIAGIAPNGSDDGDEPSEFEAERQARDTLKTCLDRPTRFNAALDAVWGEKGPFGGDAEAACAHLAHYISQHYEFSPSVRAHLVMEGLIEAADPACGRRYARRRVADGCWRRCHCPQGMDGSLTVSDGARCRIGRRTRSRRHPRA